MDDISLYTEVNACGIISISFIGFIFENYYIHVSHDMSKQ